MKPLCEVILVLSAVCAADPVPSAEQKPQPKIVASPMPEPLKIPTPMITPGSAVPLDVNKFIWLTVENHVGPVTFKSSKQDKAFVPPDLPPKAIEGDHHLGVKQGENGIPKWHKKPAANSQPCIGLDSGVVVIEAWGVLDGKAKQIAELTMQVGPAPPKVDPEPVDPVKPVSVNPFGTTKGLHVMMTYRDNFPLPIGQHNAIYGGTVRNYLNAKCETTDSYRIWKTNTQTAGDDPKIWKDAFARKRTADEWILIGNGTTGYEGPLPATVEETLALLKKYESK